MDGDFMSASSLIKKFGFGTAAAALALVGLAAAAPEAVARDQFFFSGGFNNWGGSSIGIGYRSGGSHWSHGGWGHRGWDRRSRGRDQFSFGFAYVAPPYYYGARPYYSEPRPYYAPRSYYSYYPVGGIVVFSPPMRDRLSARTRGVYVDAYRSALAAPVGEPINWRDGRISGEVTTTRDGWAGNRYCREFRQNIIVDGRTEEAYGTACRNDADTDWQIIPN